MVSAAKGIRQGDVLEPGDVNVRGKQAGKVSEEVLPRRRPGQRRLAKERTPQAEANVLWCREL